MKISTIFAVSLSVFALLMSGCASKSMDAKNSGFFKEYGSFERSNSYAAQRVSKDFDMSKYKAVFISPVLVISAVPEAQQSASQKKLYNEIAEYVMDGYKKEIAKSGYILVDAKGADTVVLESAISAVEVHFEDEKWNQFSPIAMDVTVNSYNSYIDENVRILGEQRILDSVTPETMFESMEIIKDEKILLNGESLEFENIKPALDRWIEQVKNHFAR
ncbi:DUF3313 family protein [Sulfurimonas sp.]|uniref:DUF3313 family protein n=1 Tax=Sulfurimonas sp. TaxID=2022749 RepID=UPI0025D896CD|nr:DUF3313 family protein [Sulfurimonas sp.]MBW6488824.1 DUF3313 domain-containing protein [Sulfurimonas sp.]